MKVVPAKEHFWKYKEYHKLLHQHVTLKSTCKNPLAITKRNKLIIVLFQPVKPLTLTQFFPKCLSFHLRKYLNMVHWEYHLVPQFNTSFHLTLNFNDPKSPIICVKFLLHLMIVLSKPTAHKRNLKWMFHRNIISYAKDVCKKLGLIYK
jgi:hypothetical protein